MIRHPRRLFGLWWLLAAAFACQLTDDIGGVSPTVSSPQISQPISTDLSAETAQSLDSDTASSDSALLAVGHSRANPHPYSTAAVTIGKWEVRVLETLRGRDAWQAIHAANQFNEPAGDGWEQLLVKLQIANTSDSEDEHTLGLHVTGSRLVTHFSFDSQVVPPEPRLETSLAGGRESVGWQAYRIREDEANLLLLVESFHDFEEPTRFIALSQGAAISAESDAFRDVAPTNAGIEISQPVLLGEIATSEDWQLIVLEIISGEAAWQRILEANQFNDPPTEGMRYLLARVQISYIGLLDQGVLVNDRMFTVLDNAGAEYETAQVVDPEPEMFFELFPGGVVEGILVFQLPSELQDMVLKFQPDRYGDATVNTRYLSLTQSGR